jgi:DNA-directed RNA polymerase subunit E'/Rpb7
MLTHQAKNYTKKRQPQEKPKYDVFAATMISMKIHLKMSEIGMQTKKNLEEKIVQRTEGKCIPEGYVYPKSVKLISYSSGVVKMHMIEFQVVFECLVCNPVEGMIVSCTTRSITKAGIHAEVLTSDGHLPMKIFVARDHNYSNSTFGSIKENMNIDVRIIGKRFELNDAYIVAIASLVETGKERANKPKITVLEPTTAADKEEEEEDLAIVAEEPATDTARVSVPTLPRNISVEEGEIAE